MNQFGGNAFGSGSSQPFSTPLPQPGFGQFGNAGRFYNGGVPFQGGNVFPAGGVVFPPRSFSPGPMNGQLGSGFGVPLVPGNGFMNQPMSFPSGQQPMSFPSGQQPMSFPSGQQPMPFFPGQQQQPPFGGPNSFGSGAFERPRPRSRHSSRHRSKSRRRHSSSSSDDERQGRGSPFAGPGIQYQNFQPFPNAPPLPPRADSPGLSIRRPVW